MELNLSDKKNILIIRLSSFGDILLTTPLLRAIKKNNPDAAIDFILREEFEDLLIQNPRVRKIYKFTNHKFEKQILFNAILAANYDLVIDLQNNLRSRELVRVLSCPVVKFRKKNIYKFLLVHFKINKLKNSPPIPVRYAQAVKGLKLDEEGLEFYTDRQPNPKLNKNTNYIGLCPGSKHFTKRWPTEYYIELGKRFEEAGYTVLLFGGTEDENLCEEISGNLKAAINLCSSGDLLQTGADMKMCKVVYTNDSGLMHLATALKIPVMAFFGSTIKEFGFFPYNAKSFVLENEGLSCRPCTHIGRKSCPKKHFKCMKEISPAAAFNCLRKLLSV